MLFSLRSFLVTLSLLPTLVLLKPLEVHNLVAAEAVVIATSKARCDMGCTTVFCFLKSFNV